MCAFPVGEERKEINKAFDELISMCKEKKLLNDFKVSELGMECNQSDGRVRHSKIR